MTETLIARFFANADRLGPKPMLTFPAHGHWIPMGWRTAARAVRDFASALMDLGHQKGDAVAILSETRREWCLADLGCMAAGGVTVGVYPTMTADQTRYLIAHCDAKVLVVENKQQFDKLSRIRHELPRLQTVIVIDEKGIEPGGFIALHQFMEQGRTAQSDVDGRMAKLGLTDAATFVYTSGTTGPPKGAMLSHGNIAGTLIMLEVIPVLEDDLGFAFLPLAHILQRLVSYHGVWTGTPGVFARSMATVAEDLQVAKPTIVASVPRVFEKVYHKIQAQVAESPPARQKIFAWALKVGREASRLRRAGASVPKHLELQLVAANALVFDKIGAKLGGRIRLFLSGGAPISRDILEFFDAAGITILEAWGMSETCAAGTINLPGAQRFGSIGRALAGCDVRLAEDGELLIRGPNVFQGYYKDEEATRQAFTPDGYLRTGDICQVDAEGFYTIVDRKKDIIITAQGKNVAPQNIENLLKSDPLIAQVVVIGDKHPYLVALLWPNPELVKGLSATEIATRVEKSVAAKNADLASYERVRKFRLLPHELTEEGGEITPSQKVKRKVVTEKFSSLVQAMYAEPSPGTAEHVD